MVESTSIEPGKDYSSLTPVLAAEMGKPPFEPKVAGRIAFFFGPIAGALVSVVSLRRAGYPLRSGKILRWTLLVSAAMAVVLVILPDALGRLLDWPRKLRFTACIHACSRRNFTSGREHIRKSFRPMAGEQSAGECWAWSFSLSSRWRSLFR